MDKDFLLDLLVSVRERNIDVNTALDEICAMANNVEAGENTLPIQRVMPRILHFVDENGNNVDLNAAGVNAKLLRDGTFEYFISYGFAGRKDLTPVYRA